MSLLSRPIDDPRTVTVAVAAVVAVGLWLALWIGMSDMDMSGMDMPGMGGGAMPLLPGMVAATALMWVLMMAAMMLPAMTPVMAVYASAAAREDRGMRLAARIALFTLGYLAVWTVAALALALLQLGLRGSSHFAMGGTLAGPLAAGVLTLVAGAYQLTPLKETCLKHCRHPLTYLIAHWREGLAGAFPVGFGHGLYCLGCCIALMGLMFVFGAMNVLWMAVIAVYLLAEKTLPKADRWGRFVGVALLVIGSLQLGRVLLGM